MWLSLSWLGEFVDLADRDPQQIAEDLTMRTALIESVARRGEIDQRVVIGRVLERSPHPNADRLSVCEVDLGGETLSIVCGAPNLSPGQTVVVAPVGARLPGDLKIKRSKIRGTVSHGMICSERELELGEGHEGILVLEEGLELGQAFRELRGVSDVLLEIDNKSVTHRPDLWGHEGFGRELAAIYGLAFRPVEIDRQLSPGSGPLEVRIEAPELCGRYHALFVEGALGAPSPGWMQRRLAHCGLRPHSLGVDVSNYVMLEIGQPNHPFDSARIAGGVIRIRAAVAGEELVTLDGELRSLPEGALVIADAERPIALAGIMGGESTGIQGQTERVVVESAWFEPVAVRATSTALGLRTDALARFEKSLDPGLAERGLRRYASVLRQVVPELKIETEFAAAGEFEQAPIRLRLRGERARLKLGTGLSSQQMESNLTRLGFEVTPEGDDLLVNVPSFRGPRDIDCEDDLIEEVGRLHGYDQIEGVLPSLSCGPARLPPVNRARRACVHLMSGRMRFAEVASYPYVEEEILERAGGAGASPYLLLRNPLQRNARRLRRSQIPYLLEFVDRNVKAVEEVRLYECGRVFLPRESASDLPYEPVLLSAALAQRVSRTATPGTVLRRLKGVLEELARDLRRPLRFETLAAGEVVWAHPVRSAAVFQDGRQVGLIAQVHPDLSERFGWQGETAAFEIDLTKLVETEPRPLAYRRPAKYPSVRVDLSFLLPFSMRFDSICEQLKQTAPDLGAIELVDEYVSAEMESGQRSLTLRFTFRSEDRTLSDEDVAEQFKTIKAWLLSNGAQLRGNG